LTRSKNKRRLKFNSKRSRDIPEKNAALTFNRKACFQTLPNLTEISYVLATQQKKNNLTVLSIIAFSFLAIFSAFDFSVKSQNEIETFKSATPTETPHNLVGTYYNLRDYSGKFLLNNKGIETITVYPTLYNMSGQSITIPPETVGASSHRLINLNNWASLGGESFKEGSIKIFHTGKDLVLGTQIYLENDNESSSFDEKLAELTKFDTRKQEAVWWMPNRQTDVKIALSNTSETVLSINATLSRKPNKVGVTENFTLQPHQTRLLDLRNDFTDGSQFDNHGVIGLSLEHAGAKDALLARIMLKNDALGYSNVVQFSNPNTAKSNEYQGVGFHIDKLGGTQLEPIIIAKNVGTTDSNVQIKIPYTRSNGTTNTIILPIEKLKAGEMSQINANQITNIALQENIKVAGIEVNYDTPNGSVIVATHSVSPNRTQVYRVPMWDPLQQKSPTGGYPWRIEETSTTKAYIKNITDQEEDYVAFLLWQNGGEYMIGLKAIKPHQSIEIDVKKLRDDQTPDKQGRVIPLNITNGQLQWVLRRKDTLPDDDVRTSLGLIGRSEQIDFVKNVSSSYACQNCCFSSFSFGSTLPASGEYEVGDVVQFRSIETGETCYGDQFEYDRPTDNWTTTDSSIATVSSTGLATVTGVGNVDIAAHWTLRFGFLYLCPPSQQLTNFEIFTDKNKCTETPKEEENLNKLAGCGVCFTIGIPIAPIGSIISNPKINILRNGQDITSTPQNPNTQTVTVGEKISISAVVTGGTATSKLWTVPMDKVIKNYEVICTGSPGQNGGTRCNNPTSATKIDLSGSDLSQNTLNYFWWKSGENLEVQFTVTVSGVIYSKIANFNVLSPISTITAPPQPPTNEIRGVIFVEQTNGIWRLIHGEDFPLPSGIRLRHETTFPNGVSGQTQWVQTYNLNHRFQNLNGTWSKAQREGIDVTYPYPPNTPQLPNQMTDSPGQQLSGVIINNVLQNWKKVEVVDSAKTWVMFKSNTADSIWVPLAAISWGWNAVAEKADKQTWVKDSGSTPGPTGISPIEFPLWAVNVADATVVPE
jgi:hypothetical protein